MKLIKSSSQCIDYCHSINHLYAIITQQMLCYCSNNSNLIHNTSQSTQLSDEYCDALCIDSFERCGTKQGIYYQKYINLPYTKISSIDKGIFDLEGYMKIIDVDYPTEDYFGLIFQSFIIPSKSNNYTFTLSSDDGSI